MTCANTSPPLGLGWENVTVSNDGQAISRGIALAIGNPQQIVSLRLSVGDDNTWVFNNADCVSSSNDSCIGLKGGVFDFKASHTYSPTLEASWNGSHDASITDGSYIFFNDQIRFGINGTAYGFPLYMDQPGQGTQSGLGMGPGSTFQTAAVESGSAPSKAWGLWVGSRSVVQPVDGALWIGGYDTNRIGGDFLDFTTYDRCPTCVEITNITYEYPGGSASLFSNSSETLSISLEPFQRALNVPEDIFLNFARVSNGTVGTDPGTQALLTYPPDAQFGNLTITLKNGQDGYQTTTPAQELFLPPRNFNSQGQYAITNDTYLLAGLANATVKPGYVFDWGIPFLTMNYLIVDYEQKKFSLAPALRGPYGVSNGALVQPPCSGLAPTSTTAAASPTASTITTAQPTVTVTPSPLPIRHSSTNVGAIVGGVVGGVGGLLVIAILLFFLVRSRQREKAARTDRAAAIAEVHESGAKNERLSQFTGTSPTEVSEMGANNNMEHWLYTQSGNYEVSVSFGPDVRKGVRLGESLNPADSDALN